MEDQEVSPPTVQASGDDTHAPKTSGGGMTDMSQIPRSCKTCRARKVKCNKEQPCSNCVRHKIPCVYPEVVLKPNKIQKTTTHTRQHGNASQRRHEKRDLLKRLMTLENLVSSLGGLPAPEQDQQSRDSSVSLNKDDNIQERTSTSGDSPITQPNVVSSNPSVETYSALNYELGSLLLRDGKSVYVNNFFWANLTSETRQIRDLLEEELEEEEESSQESMDHCSYIFSGIPPNIEIASLSPLPSQIPFYWQTYLKNVDPIVKILHAPTTYDALMKVNFRMDKLSRGMQTILFVICFAAVRSLNEEEVSLNFGQERSELLRKLRLGVERSLVRAGFLNSHDLQTLQAFAIYVVCLSGQDHKGVIYSLAGIAILAAQNQGLHRDGSNFNLSPFDIEMRRRLWWGIASLDTCTSLNVGSDPKINDLTSDTQFPININDDEFGPDSEGPLQARSGITDTSYRLIKDEIFCTIRRFCYVPPGLKAQVECPATASLAEKEAMVRECHQRIESQYLQYLDATDSISWIIGTMARLMMSRMWLILYHPYYSYQQTRECKGRKAANHPVVALPSEKRQKMTLPLPTRRKLLASSIQILEYSTFLETDPAAMRWRWLFKQLTQWHAIALTLSELAIDPSTPLADRAWKAVEASCQLKDESSPKSARMWGLMGTLKKKAEKAREEYYRIPREKAHEMTGEAPMNVGPASSTQELALEPNDTAALSEAAASLQLGSQSTQDPSNHGLQSNGIGYNSTEPVNPVLSNTFQPFVSAEGLGQPGMNVQVTPPTAVLPLPTLQNSGPVLSADGSIASQPLVGSEDGTATVTPELDWATWADMVRDTQLEPNSNTFGLGEMSDVDGAEMWWV